MVNWLNVSYNKRRAKQAWTSSPLFYSFPIKMVWFNVSYDLLCRLNKNKRRKTKTGCPYHWCPLSKFNCYNRSECYCQTIIFFCWRIWLFKFNYDLFNEFNWCQSIEINPRQIIFDQLAPFDDHFCWWWVESYFFYFLLFTF